MNHTQWVKLSDRTKARFTLCIWVSMGCSPGAPRLECPPSSNIFFYRHGERTYIMKAPPPPLKFYQPRSPLRPKSGLDQNLKSDTDISKIKQVFK